MFTEDYKKLWFVGSPLSSSCLISFKMKIPIENPFIFMDFK